VTDNTAAERQRRQLRRDQAAGIASVRVRVPVEGAQQIRDLAQRLRWQKQIDAPFIPEDDTP